MAAQITQESTQINITDYNATTPISQCPAPTALSFRFGSPIPCTITSTPHPTLRDKQSLEWDQIPLSLRGGQAVRRSEFATAAFGRDPISILTEGVQTSPSLDTTATGPLMKEATTFPVSFLQEAPSSTATTGPPSKTSAMQYINAAALRLRTQATLAHLPPLP